MGSTQKAHLDALASRVYIAALKETSDDHLTKEQKAHVLKRMNDLAEELGL